MRNSLMAALAGGTIALATLTSTEAFAERWNMPVRSNERNYFTQNITQFAEDVKKGTGGDVEIVIHPEDSLFKQPDVKRAVQTGQVQIGELLMSIHSNESPIFGIDSVPFLATDYDQNAKLLKAARPLLEERLKKQNMRLLFVVPWPFNSIYSGKEINSVSDFQGVKFRAYNPVTGRLGELMGAVPVTVQQSEVSQAFSTGVIQAMITSPATGVDTQAWDFVKYYYDVRAMAPWNIVIVNERAFSHLGKKDQEAILAAAKAAEERGWKKAPAVTSELIGTLKSHGMEIKEPSPELQAGLHKIGEKLVEEWKASASEEGQKVLDQYRASN